MTGKLGVLSLVLSMGGAVCPGWGANPPSGEDCTFRVDPDAYLSRAGRAQRELFDQTGKVSRAFSRATPSAVSPNDIPRRNFIDVQIFDRLAAAGVASARLSSDEEFLRRVWLDLTGRIPSPDAVREFLAESSADKRNAVIDRLLNSPEFVDRWTMWTGDLFQNNVQQANVNRQIAGRNAFHNWIKGAVADGKPLKDMVYEAITASGNSYSNEEGAVNWIVGGRATMGPAQDIYDLILYQTAERFLGLGHYDCLLCHDGRRHLDDLSLWGKTGTRLDAQRMAAFFSRVQITGNNNRADPLYQSFTVTDRATGSYALATNFGNRPNRTPVGNIRALDPEYRDGSAASSGFWRADFAANVLRDPMLAMNFANRIWKALFNHGLVEPVDSLDPARLDPDRPPPEPWTLQASHPRLLKMLADELVARNYDLREFIRLLVESSAYQLSARYDAEWNISQVALFARHYPRRLEGEEIHDAIVKATGVFQQYSVGGWAEPVQWACQLPDPLEPRSNGGVRNFMNAFLRGNRDTQQRSQAGSILQQLNLMNDVFVTNRTRVTASASLRAIAGKNNDEAVEEVFLLFLGRRPSEYERGQALSRLAQATTAAQRNTAVEDLAWALINKAEFIFSY